MFSLYNCGIFSLAEQTGARERQEEVVRGLKEELEKKRVLYAHL